MKVCIDAREFKPGRTTGISRYLEALLEPLHQKNDLEICLLADTPSAIPSSLQCLPVQKLSSPSTWRQDFLEIPRLLKTLSCDLFFSPYYKTPLRGRFKRITTVHDILFLRRTDEPAWRRLLIRGYLRLSSNRSDLILTDSDFTRRDFLNLLPGLAHKTKLLYPGLTSFWDTPTRPDDVEKARAIFPGKRPYFLYVGNFKPHKNVDLLIQGYLAFCAIHPKDAPGLLLAGGDASNLERIQRFIVGHEDCIRILKHPSDGDLKALYTAAHWLVTASAYEGFGYPLIEAMACQCPIISPKTTSLNEIAEDAALYVQTLDLDGLLDTLCRAHNLLNDDRVKLIENGKKRLKTFRSGQASTQFASMVQGLTKTAW